MIAEVIARLEEIVKYLKPLLPLANCHMVNFITNGMWEIYVPDAIKKEFSSVKPEVFNTIFLHYAKEISMDKIKGELESVPNFANFLESARNMCLRGISAQGIVVSLSDLQAKLAAWGYEYQESLHLEQFMTLKKVHEVEIMSQMVAALACISHASHVVDVGGGKGYLSSLLALHYGLRVLGVDSSHVNTHGAAKRTQKLEKRWNGLCQRTNILKQGDVPPCKGKHRKPHNNANSTKGCECTGAEADINCRLQSESSALYKQVTMFVTQQTDLCSLVKDHFNSDRCEHLSITGLHTCGDLAPACLRIFANKEECGSVSNVGCCYHLMEEEYVRSPFWTDTNPPLPTGVQPGFPVSKCLHMQEFSLGRNARMLAAHSLDRIGEYHEVSTDEIVSLYKTHSVEQQQLHVFFLLRVALAPVIEAVILLDRLLYLLEQGIQDSYLVQLFDPVISPRCYCIVSLKNYPGKGTD
ncbi:hypothetical protein B7P43_G00556 [Cryptotermes secundus]|uniref:Methyltransferase domain-containing protein n=1 Tax=Cryptotermes secundus TaxID=105785 RepID=A0A2J7QY51_9NEOP|nr:hypothetical protein B7P43_G00556 [Cryptotermes secundus]